MKYLTILILFLAFTASSQVYNKTSTFVNAVIDNSIGLQDTSLTAIVRVQATPALYEEWNIRYDESGNLINLQRSKEYTQSDVLRYLNRELTQLNDNINRLINDYNAIVDRKTYLQAVKVAIQ